MTELLLAPPFAKIGRQQPRQFGDHLLTIFGPLPLEQFAVNASADLPVELGEFGIDRAGHPLSGGINEMAHIGKQSVIGWNGVGHIVCRKQNFYFYLCFQ